MSDPWRDAPKTLAELVSVRLGAMSRAERETFEAAPSKQSTMAAEGGHARSTLLFPASYTATKQFVALTAEGAALTAEGDACCSKEVPACVVEAQTSSATEYQDAVSLKVRTEPDRLHAQRPNQCRT